MTAPAELPAFPPGTLLLDKYRVVRHLGAGGMGFVVCAEHLGLGTRVAFKFLLPDLAALPDAAPRFVREARAASRIVGEHVTRVLDVGALPDGLPYMIMEYLDGEDLGRHVKAGKRFSIQEAIGCVVQAAEALAQAHAAGIVHRDVKPSNLFLTHRADGTPLVKVLDFGISKVVSEAAQENLQLTKTNAVMGSALYMSLEQMKSARTVDHRTDIYALGVSLYELLTGTHPFMADSFSALCVKVSLDPPDPLRRHRPDVPEDLAEAIAVAYARHQEERYQTVGGFALALAPFAADETVTTIDAIVRFERASYPEGKVPVRMLTPFGLRATEVQRPPRLRWPAFAVAAGVGVAAAGALWVTWNPGGGQGTVLDAGIAPVEAGPIVTSAPDAAPTESAVVPVVSVSVQPEPPDAGGAAATDAGARKPPQRPDAGAPALPRCPSHAVCLPGGPGEKLCPSPSGLYERCRG